jgi:hypothetical protein
LCVEGAEVAGAAATDVVAGGSRAGWCAWIQCAYIQGSCVCVCVCVLCFLVFGGVNEHLFPRTILCTSMCVIS